MHFSQLGIEHAVNIEASSGNDDDDEAASALEPRHC